VRGEKGERVREGRGKECRGGYGRGYIKRKGRRRDRKKWKREKGGERKSVHLTDMMCAW